MSEFPPHLWSILVGDAEVSDFVRVTHLSGFESFYYTKGKWPKQNSSVAPGIVQNANLKVWMTLYYVKCPLCQCVSVKSENSLNKKGKVFFSCPGWNGQVRCPGYFVNFGQSEATCCIH